MKRFGLVASVFYLSIATSCTRAPAAGWAPVAATANAVAEPVRAALVGEGSLEVRGERTAATTIAVERLRVTAETSGDVAQTTVEHTFRNDSDEQLEGTFRFPLPEGCVLTGLELEIDGRLVPGELVEREKARQAYEQIVDQMRDPALFEWENARTFKLRVFPIEPKRTKRVVLRFIAPLYRTEQGLFFAMRLPSLDRSAREERVTLAMNGKSVDPKEALRAPTGELCFRVDDPPDRAALVSESTHDGTYLHAHVRPSLGEAPAHPAAAPQAVILLCDRSRSMLEARQEQARLLQMVLETLRPGDRFAVVVGDVRARAMTGGLRPATPDAVREALAFLQVDEPDGASNLADLIVAGGLAATQARGQGLMPSMVYLGDANPTWGETRPAELERIAQTALGGAPLHIALLGKSTDDALARAMAARAHGRLLSPKSEDDARRAAKKIVEAAGARRLDDVRLTRADGIEVALEPPPTVFEGDDVDVSLFVPAGRDLTGTTDLAIVGTAGGKPLQFPIHLGSATPARFVSQRWAAAKIEALEHEADRNKEAIIKTSLDHGVMSRYTSFLVLESEEAYERLHIARRAHPAEAGDARVSSRDLEGEEGTSASVSPDHLQPGDPEVRITAPADAQSVVVVFPFGETKSATYEPDNRGGMWVVRFLVDRHTKDGNYEILVRITHADGRVQLVKVPYVVDTRRPQLHVLVVARGRSYTIRAKQELAADAKRVEVKTPDGQVLSLTHIRLGEFAGVWTPRRPVGSGSPLRVIAVDRALNESVTEALIP